MGYSYTQIKELADRVRYISLSDVISITGALRDKYDNNKWHTSKGTISITGQKFMNWSVQKGGGGAIDLIIHLYQLDFISAVLFLAERFSNPHCPSPHILCEKNDVFRPPEKNKNHLPAIIHYLNHKRRIPMNLICQFVKTGQIYADNRSNAVFLLLGKEKNIVGAELRGITDRRWVGMAKGSKKELGAFSVKSDKPKSIIICESAIDAMSCFALFPDCIAVSNSGAHPSPTWLSKIINCNIRIFCGFDDDDTGNRIANEMIRLYPGIKRLKPQKHDWNDTLISKIQSD
jgi:5S rRNA maturation endonuclease (ribonuclease M5)